MSVSTVEDIDWECVKSEFQDFSRNNPSLKNDIQSVLNRCRKVSSDLAVKKSCKVLDLASVMLLSGIAHKDLDVLSNNPVFKKKRMMLSSTLLELLLPIQSW